MASHNPSGAPLIRLETPAGEVSVVIDDPSEGARYLVLGHGAGGSVAGPPSAVAFARALAEAGIGTVRFNFAYREAGRKMPDRTAVMEATYRAVAEHVSTFAGVLLIGGRSMGGRIGSHIVAQGFPCDGLVFLGYPLHPPDKPEKIRDAHLPDIAQPMLWIQGANDDFARADLLDATIARLPTATLHRIDGADHSLKVRGRAPDDVTAELVATTIGWAGALP